MQDDDCDEERVPEITDDGELDLSDEDDTDFLVDVISTKWSKRERAPAARKRPVNNSFYEHSDMAYHFRCWLIILEI